MNVQVRMELDTTVELAHSNENKIKQQPKLELIKEELPEINDFYILQEVSSIKSETVSTDDKLKEASFNTVEPEDIGNQSLELKFESLPQDCYFESDGNFYIKQELLHEELDIKSEDKIIQEPQPDSKYNCGNELYKHIKITKEVKPFNCNVCEYSCLQESSLKRHLLTHTAEKPFKCNICDYSSRYNFALKNHFKIHTGDKSFECNICFKRFGVRNHLKRHLIIHTGEKPFKCKICDYSFGRNGTLNNHLKTHSAEKSFKCGVCDYSCHRKDALKSHLTIHTGEKPFKCNICNYSCRRNRYLKMHLLTHDSKKPF